MMFKTAVSIVKHLNRNGFKAYFAGGSVRDQLLNKNSTDIDIATNATPKQIQKLFKKTIPVGIQFGIVIVRKNKMNFEVATFRKESTYTDGRHPTHVTWVDDKEDAFRRDFTVNGMFYDPLTHKILDYVGGKQDIKRKLIRTIGDPHKRFKEDQLRMLRAIRFSCQLGFKIDSKTLQAIKRNHRKIRNISPERIREELNKLLMSHQADHGIKLLEKTGLLKIILPEVLKLKGVHQPRKYHPEGDVYKHTLLMLKLKGKSSVEIAWSVLLHDIGKPDTYTRSDRIRFNRHVEVGMVIANDILKRLKFSNVLKDNIIHLIACHMKFVSVFDMKALTLKKFLLDEQIENHLELHRIDCLGSHGKLDAYSYCRKELEKFKNEPPPLKPLIRGRDLIGLGYKPGPIFSKMINDIHDCVLERTLKTKKEAINYILKNYPK